MQLLSETRDISLIDPCVLVDMVIGGCNDKSKMVRDKISLLSPRVTGFLNQDVLNQRIKEQKPIIRDTLTNSLKKAGFLKQSLEPLIKHNTKKVNTSEYEKALRILDSTPSLSKTIYLQSVLNFSEPTDIEISNLHSQLAYILDDTTARQLFSFESAMFQQTMKQMMMANIYTKENITGILQLIYIRVFDTRRKIVLDAVENYLEFLHHTMIHKNLYFDTKKDVLVCLHTILKFSLASQKFDLASIFLSLMHNDTVIKEIEYLLSTTHSVEYEDGFLKFLEQILGAIDPKTIIPRELILKLKKFEPTHKNSISNIFQSLKVLNQYNSFLEDPELSHAFDKVKNIVEEVNFNDIKVIDSFLRNSSKDNSQLQIYLDDIMLGFMKFNGDLILADNMYAGSQKLSYLKLSIDVSRMISNIKGALEKVKPSTSTSFLEQLIACLLKIDENKAAFDFVASKAFSADEIIQNLNFCVLKLLELNDPNILFELLLNLLDKSNKELLDPTVTRNAVKFRGIVVKCIIKLTKAMRKFIDRLDIRRLLELFKWYFKDYKNIKEDVGLKSVKTVLNELVSIKGEDIGKYMVGIEDDTDQAFMMCISKYLGKCKKEDATGDTERKAKMGDDRLNKSSFSNN